MSVFTFVLSEWSGKAVSSCKNMSNITTVGSVMSDCLRGDVLAYIIERWHSVVIENYKGNQNLRMKNLMLMLSL